MRQDRDVAVIRAFRVELPPDVFAVVMATGIMAIAADDHRYSRIGDALAAAATVAFVALTIGLLLGLVTRLATLLGAGGGRRGVVLGDARDPDVTLRMFTFVAGAAVLGVMWRARPGAVWVLAVLAAIGWLVLMPLLARGVRSRPAAELRDHARGAWLLVSVATAGLATTVADLAIIEGAYPLLVAGLVLWAVGVACYLAITGLIIWRATARPLRPDAMTPDSWILMGALAIATLAGAHLLQACDALGSAQALWRAVAAATLALWAVATAWIPFLLYAQMWRVDQRPGSLRFAGVWWSAVFPLGMYASATAATAAELGIGGLVTVSLVFFWIGLVVWTLVAVGLARFALGKLRRRPG